MGPTHPLPHTVPPETKG